MNTPANETSFIDEWWSRIRAGERLIQRCESCGNGQLHPRRRCNQCGAPKLHFESVGGEGTLYTFTTIYHNAPSDFIEEVPYTLAIVRLKEGPQMLSRLVNHHIEDLTCDMPVKWKLEELGGKLLPCFEPA